MGLCMGAWQLHPGRTSPREKHWPWPAWLGEVEENGIDVTEEISMCYQKVVSTMTQSAWAGSDILRRATSKTVAHFDGIRSATGSPPSLQV